MISLLVALIIFGVILWGVDQLPLDTTVRTIIRVVAIVALVIWVARAFFPGSVAGPLA